MDTAPCTSTRVGHLHEVSRCLVKSWLCWGAIARGGVLVVEVGVLGVFGCWVSLWVGWFLGSLWGCRRKLGWQSS